MPMHPSKNEFYKVELRDIAKYFGGVTALGRVTLKVKKGEIHALMGENGAGKSTLMKILSGAHQRDKGKIFVDGKEVEIRNTHDSQKLGIGIIYQEFSLVPELSVAENIFLNHLTEMGPWMKWEQMRTKAEELIDSLGFAISPSEKVKNLSIAQQQVVEIAKALSHEVSVLILDEPSAVLGPHELKALFKVLNRLKSEGTAIIYISHRLEEIFQIGDRVTVLRNGTSSDTYEVADIDADKIINLMLGRRLEALFPPHTPKIGKELLKVENISVEDKVKSMSFSVREGEILGIAGLVGSGRTETLQALFSAVKWNGKVELAGKRLNLKSPSQAVKNGIGMVPEDRKSQGVITSMSIKKNMTLTNLKQISNRLGFIDSKKETEVVGRLMETLRVKAQNMDMAVDSLSGGNQQKVVMGKWINRDCSVMLIDEPTRGVDVGAKVEIYNEINALSDKGLGIVVVSSETAELLGICDRILVMHNGVMQGELQKEEFSEENVLRLAISDKNG